MSAWHDAVAAWKYSQAPEPVDVRVDGVVIVQWPAVVETANRMDTAVECLATGYESYKSQIGYLNFAEVPVDLLRRLAKHVAAVSGVDATELADLYMRVNGKPT